MKKIVVIGGGTGSFTILSGLKKYPVELISIVSMMDSGGSTGILRDEFGVLPPGDVRRCLVALSDSTIMRELFEYRFKKGKALNGHTVGNLLLTALNEITGSDEEAILKASDILRIKGKVLPVTLNNCHLGAEFANGKKVIGEAKIGKQKVKHIFLTKKAKIFSEAKKAILSADLIILGPGDFYTSILPNLLVTGVTQAINKSKAKTVFVCNIMTKGETKGFKAKDFVEELSKYLQSIPDFVLMNNKKPSLRVIKRYKKEGSEFVEPNYFGIKRDLLRRTDYARHEPQKLAKEIIKISKN
ncbi:MAG: gluconeogenesis factor YvcK family protein [archaeon]